MHGKEHYTPEARGAKMRADFMESAKTCGNIARFADGDVPERDLAGMCKMARDLETVLSAMRARVGHGFK